MPGKGCDSSHCGVNNLGDQVGQGTMHCFRGEYDYIVNQGT